MDVTQVIQNNIEQTRVQTGIIEVLEHHNQKPLTKRHIDELKEKVDDSIYLSRQFGMTHITWNEGDTEYQLLISHNVKNVKIDTVDIVDKNPGYFDALRKRNQRRQVALTMPDKIKELETLIAQFTAVRHRLRTALESDGVFGTEKYTIIEAFALENGI